MSTDVGSHAGTIDLTSNPDEGNHPDSSRGYSGPMMRQYRPALVGGFVTIVLLATAIALSATSLKQSNEALALATANADAAQTLEIEFNGISDNYDNGVQDTVVEAGGGDAVQHVSDDHESAPAIMNKTPSPSLRPTPNPTTSAPTTSAPTAPQPTGTPTESHPLNPKWFHTDHEDYQTIINTDGNQDHHPWLIAGLFCHRQNLQPCSINEYCPNGKGNNPFHGGPPKISGWEGEKEEQWSPVAGETQADGFLWIQVGSIPMVDGGVEGNRCWNWDEFAWGKGEDIMTVRGEDYMKWILCCERV